MAYKIGETFGANVINDGVVDRKALGRIVFADKVSSSFTCVISRLSQGLCLN